jgi:hypothetical protein
MPYSDFTLKQIKEQLGITVIENQDLFSAVEEIGISEYLAETLKYNISLPLAVGERVTTDNTWKLLKYKNGAVFIDVAEYHPGNIGFWRRW